MRTFGLAVSNILILLLYAAGLIIGYQYVQNLVFLIGAVVFAFGVVLNDMIINKKNFVKSCQESLILILLLEVIFVVITLISRYYYESALNSVGLTYEVWIYTIFTFLSIKNLLIKDSIYWIRTANLKINKYLLKSQAIKLLIMYIAGIILFLLLNIGLQKIFAYIIFDSQLENLLAQYLPYAAYFGLWRTIGFKLMNSDALKYETTAESEEEVPQTQTLEEKYKMIEDMIAEELENEELVDEKPAEE